MGGEGEDGFQPTCPNLPAPGGTASEVLSPRPLPWGRGGRYSVPAPPLSGVAGEGDIAFLYSQRQIILRFRMSTGVGGDGCREAETGRTADTWALGALI